MREILESCARIDEAAEAAYLDMQTRCTETNAAALLGHLAAGKAVHAGWWRELRRRTHPLVRPSTWTRSSGSSLGPSKR